MGEGGYALADGGAELKNAGAKPGQTVCFYIEPYDDSMVWFLWINEGHYGETYINLGNGGEDYDLAANGGKVGITLTQEMLDTLYVQQWWGGTFVLQGDNVTCTKITLQK